MNLEEIKEEIRNKRGALISGILATGFAFAAAGAPTIGVLGVLVAAVACGMLGGTDWSLGRKLPGGLFCAFAVFLFFLGAGMVLAEDECRRETRSEAAMAKCRDVAAAASAQMRRISGVTLLLLLINPMIGWGYRERLQKPGTFAARYGGQEQTKIPNRWFSKEKDFEVFVLEELDHAGITGRQRYEWICDVRGLAPERYDGGARYDWKARQLLNDAPWQSVYDLVERCWPILGFLHRGHFERRVNEYLRGAQVGWVFGDGKWTRIGDDIGTANLERAADACEELDAEDALRDLRNAWKLCNELGEGYEKDAVASATRALERIVQERTSQSEVNLNRIKWEAPNVPHEKLRGVINTLYSYSSDQARHANQGAVISAKDAHFVVSVVAILISYLAQWDPLSNADKPDEFDGTVP